MYYLYGGWHHNKLNVTQKNRTATNAEYMFFIAATLLFLGLSSLSLPCRLSLSLSLPALSLTSILSHSLDSELFLHSNRCLCRRKMNDYAYNQIRKPNKICRFCVCPSKRNKKYIYKVSATILHTRCIPFG